METELIFLYKLDGDDHLQDMLRNLLCQKMTLAPCRWRIKTLLDKLSHFHQALVLEFSEEFFTKKKKYMVSMEKFLKTKKIKVTIYSYLLSFFR